VKKNYIKFNCGLVKYLSRILKPDEAMFYLTAKYLTIKGVGVHKRSVASIERCLPGAKAIANKLKRKNLLPSGRLDLSRIDDMLRKACRSGIAIRGNEEAQIYYAEKEYIPKAKLLVATLKTGISRHSRDILPPTWYVIQYKTAYKMLTQDHLPYERLKNCIESGVRDSWWGPKLTTMKMVQRYWPNYLKKQVITQNSIDSFETQDDGLWVEAN